MGHAEIALALGVSGTRVGQLRVEDADFPLPIGILKMGRVYLAEDVEKWVAERKAKAEEKSR